MNQLTSVQLSNLSAQFKAVGEAVLNYRVANEKLINDEEDRELEGFQNTILNNAGKLNALSAIAVGDEAEKALNQLTGINTGIIQTMAKLGNVQHVINIASCMLNIITAILSLKPADIVASVAALNSEISPKANS